MYWEIPFFYRKLRILNMTLENHMPFSNIMAKFIIKKHVKVVETIVNIVKSVSILTFLFFDVLKKSITLCYWTADCVQSRLVSIVEQNKKKLCYIIIWYKLYYKPYIIYYSRNIIDNTSIQYIGCVYNKLLSLSNWVGLIVWWKLQDQGRNSFV